MEIQHEIERMVYQQYRRHLGDAVVQELIDLLKAGKKAAAVKRFAEEMGIRPGAAKDMVDVFEQRLKGKR